MTVKRRWPKSLSDLSDSQIKALVASSKVEIPLKVVNMTVSLQSLATARTYKRFWTLIDLWSATDLPLKFNFNKEERPRLEAIADRMVELDDDFPFNTVLLDLLAVHCNGMPLDIEKLYRFDDFNLAHDVYGINRHLDRSTGQLGGCFVPRCAKPESRLPKTFGD